MCPQVNYGQIDFSLGKLVYTVATSVDFSCWFNKVRLDVPQYHHCLFEKLLKDAEFQ